MAGCVVRYSVNEPASSDSGNVLARGEVEFGGVGAVDSDDARMLRKETDREVDTDLTGATD